MPETLFECAGPRLAGQTSFQADRRKIPTPEKPLDQLAGFPFVRPYEAGHMSSFQASPNRPGTPEPATTVSLSGVAAILPPLPDTAAAFSCPGLAPHAMNNHCEHHASVIYRENRIQESGVRIQEKSGSCLFSWTGLAPTP
jgi:hypothetical protein